MRAPIIPPNRLASASIVRGRGNPPPQTHDQAVGARNGEMDGSKGKFVVTEKAMLQTAMTGALDDVPFILFSPETLEKYEQRKAKVIREYGFLPRRQPTILDGSILPRRFEPVPSYFYNKPIEELENGIYEKTFCVLSLRFHKNFVHRFTATDSVFIFSPWNSIRKACVALVTNQYFDYLMILTILVNCVFLALSNPIEQAEYAFLSIYTTEMLIKSIAKGFVLNKYTYLRNPWNWLDFVVIVLGYVTIFVDLGRFSGLRTFRVFRALKTVSILPGLKTIVNALLHSVKMLAEVMMLTVFCIMVFALFALQIYMGQLRNKCVRIPDANLTDEEYFNFTQTEDNWLKDEEDHIVVCGNASGALPCSENYTCLRDIGDNPNFGYTSFDNFGAAMLTTFQLITLDFWENVYNNVIYCCGPFNVIFFVFVVFFGSFYLVNLMLAVVAMSYEEEVEATQSESKTEQSFEDAETQLTPKKPKKKRIITRRGAITVTEPISDTESPDLPLRPITQAQRPTAQAQRPPTQAQRRPVTPLRTPLKTEAAHVAEPTEDRHQFVVGNRTTKNQIPAPGAVPFSRYKNAVNNRKSRQQRPAPARAVVNARSIILCECGMEGCDQSASPCTFGVGIPCISDTPPTAQGHDNNNRGVGAPPPAPPPPPPPPPAHPLPPMQTTNIIGVLETNENTTVNVPAPGVVSRDSAISTGTNTYQRALSELYKSAPDTLYDERKQTQVLVLDDNLPDRNCACCSRCCCQYTLWLRLQKLANSIVSDPLVELFITACIIVNTVFLAIEHHGMSPSLKEVLSVGNKVFTTIFTIETTLKLISLSKEYFKISWNVFDLIIVVFSLIELGLEGINGLSVLRALRLLRVFKLAQSWTTMRVLLSIIVSTLGALGNLTLVLVIIMYIFAVLGMQLFGKNYTPDKFEGGELPRWHFQDFVHSFMMIFRVLCGEWIEPLWDCMLVSGETCMAIFLPALVVGNFMVLNLFLALLLSSFNSEELAKNNKKDEEVSRLMKGLQRLRNIFCCFCMIYIRRKRKLQRQVSEETEPDDTQEIVMKSEMVTDYTNTVYEDDESQPVNNRKTISMPHNLNLPNHTYANNTLEVPRPVTVATMEAVNHRPPVRERPMARRISWTPVVDYVDSLRHGSMESLEISDTLLQVSTPMESHSQIKVDASTQTTDHKGTLKKRVHAKDAREEQVGNSNGNANVVQMSNNQSPQKKPKPYKHQPQPKSTQAADPTDPPSADAFLQSSLAIVDNPDDVIPLEERNPEDCFPEWFYKKCCCCKAMLTSRLAEIWFQFRKRIIRIVDHWIFEWAILVLIFASSVTLCFEDINLDSNPTLKLSLYYLNIIFCVIYAAEMLLKWLAHGFVVYFKNGWSVLDFIIVVASILSVVVDGNKNLIALRSVRTLRALRPLRAISRWQGMKIVVNALMSAIPSIFNVLLVCIVFWLIFSIMGVQFFAGRFYQCLDEKRDRLNISTVNNKSQCLNQNYSWVNEPVNFDNVGQGYLALFQVATFEGWIEVMQAAVDARGIDLQPEAEANLTAYFYFIVFIVCGSFFTLNLFIGVIIDNFNMLKKKYEGGVMNIFLTESQKKYYAAMKKLGRKKPQKLIRRPTNKCQAAFYDLSMSRRFEMLVFVVIMLNMISMAIDHYKQSPELVTTLETLNIVFTSLFTVEAVIKIIGLRQYYFTVPWNIFDFVLVISSILGIVLKDILTSSNFFVSPTLLRVVRVFRIGRILRLIKAAKGIRKLLFALVVSLPALFNIGALLFLIMFIYSIIGMSLFAHIKHTGVLNKATNFETFGRSMLLLFRLLTSAGWNDILEPLMVQPPDCEPNFGKHPSGNCGSSTFAIIFLVSYVIINFMIIINMYIAVILENFNQAHQEEELGIIEDDLEMFYINWAKYDPHAAQFISFWELSDFVDTLDPPLRIPKPNQIALVSFNLPIAKGMKIHCLDILHALVKHVLGHVEETEDFQKLRSQMEEKFKKQFPTRKQLELVTTTLQWKRYNFAARIVQQAYRNHKFKRQKHESGLGSSQVLNQAVNNRPSSKFGRGLRTLSQFLSLPKALPGSPSRRSAKSRPASSAKPSNSNHEGDIFFFQPKT